VNGDIAAGSLTVADGARMPAAKLTETGGKASGNR
jgi:hypothetical protein